MSELALIQKAIEESQQKMSQLFDAQKAEIESTGQVSKQLQSADTALTVTKTLLSYHMLFRFPTFSCILHVKQRKEITVFFI